MPTLNFKHYFVDKILDGSKTHTMRFGARQIRQGQLLYCQYGQRFKPTRFAVLPAMRVRKVTLTRETVMVWNEDGMSFTVPPLDQFSRADGFQDWDDLKNWFDQVYGFDRTELQGQLVQWVQASWELNTPQAKQATQARTKCVKKTRS